MNTRTTHLHFRRGGNAAYGLLALLIVAAIILYVMFGMGGGSKSGSGGGGGGGGGGYMGAVGGSVKTGRALANDINGKQIAQLVAAYRQEKGKLPASIDDLEAPQQTITDKWGNKMSISFAEKEGASGLTKMTIRSNGPDGQANTPDDVIITEDVPY